MNEQATSAVESGSSRFVCLHTFRRKALFLCFLIAGVLGTPAKSRAVQVAADLTFNLGDTTQNLASSMEGWYFQVTSEISITSVGWFDASGDGLAASHQVGIWDTTQQLLYSTDFPSGTAGTLGADTFRYVSIPSLNLQPGNTYVIAGLTTTGDAYIIPGNANQGPSSVSYAAEITYLGAAEGGAAFQYPTFLFGGALARFGPNFEYTVVPEPSRLMLVAFGSMLVALQRRRRTPKG